MFRVLWKLVVAELCQACGRFRNRRNNKDFEANGWFEGVELGEEMPCDRCRAISFRVRDVTSFKEAMRKEERGRTILLASIHQFLPSFPLSKKYKAQRKGRAIQHDGPSGALCQEAVLLTTTTTAAYSASNAID